MISWGGEEELKQLEKEQGSRGRATAGSTGGCETDGGTGKVPHPNRAGTGQAGGLLVFGFLFLPLSGWGLKPLETIVRVQTQLFIISYQC